jgi:hypothetical protein
MKILIKMEVFDEKSYLRRFVCPFLFPIAESKNHSRQGDQFLLMKCMQLIETLVKSFKDKIDEINRNLCINQALSFCTKHMER